MQLRKAIGGATACVVGGGGAAGYALDILP